LEINLELSENLASFDEVKRLQKFEEEVADRIYEELSVRARINLVEPMTIRRSQGGKMERVLDLRE
jgi:phenylacetate-coenzyme A ligase PaaK-like adenylate-forming protein